jgi:hypothetical protein
MLRLARNAIVVGRNVREIHREKFQKPATSTVGTTVIKLSLTRLSNRLVPGNAQADQPLLTMDT